MIDALVTTASGILFGSALIVSLSIILPGLNRAVGYLADARRARLSGEIERG